SLIAIVALLLIVACGKDDITTVSPSSDEGDVDYSDMTFNGVVNVVFSATDNAVVSGAGSNQTVSVSGNGVTIVNTGSDLIQYNVSGATSNGYLKIYSGVGQSVVLNGVSITNPNGAAINIQGPAATPSKGKIVYMVLNGSSTLTDGNTYGTHPDNEDEKGVIFAEGSINISGSGSLTVNAKGKSGIVSDDNLTIADGTIAINATSSTFVSNGDTTKVAGLKAKDALFVNGGTLTVTSSGTGCKGISGDGTATFSGGTARVSVSGSNFGSSSSGGGMQRPGGFGGQSSDNSVAAKGIKFDGNITFSGGTVIVTCSNHEGIESKGEIEVTAGHVYSKAGDDAINSASNMTISGGSLCAYSTGNDGLDANGNIYIKGGVVYAIGTSSPEVGIDANTEDGYKLYVQGGTIIAIGGIESGSSLSQSCYSASSWTRSSWYSLTVGSTTYAFQTPASGGSGMVVSASSQPTLKSGVSASGGTSYFEGMMLVDASVSGGSSVSLSAYSGGNSGGGPGGNGDRPGGNVGGPGRF
ncbi:MAG: carbohydrate-binding domain-containing protein, partial [Bacteroidales bacterium]|nr:carbohydrate-binding domain-containing protein [Bacteroidales bacterium]